MSPGEGLVVLRPTAVTGSTLAAHVTVSSWEAEMSEIEQRRVWALSPPAEATVRKVAKRKAAGQLSIRERIRLIADIGSFHEIGPIAGKERGRSSHSCEIPL